MQQSAIVLCISDWSSDVCSAVLLKKHGAKKGDRVCIYLPMVPELAVAVLACARIGAIHSVVFGGFSARSIAERIQDAQCSIVITADGSFRGAKPIPMKEVIEAALEQCTSIKTVMVHTSTCNTDTIQRGRDDWQL